MKKMTWQEVHQVGLDILKDIHEFCVENDIKYSLSGGSLLGAIRHNGFIPWDDDIDIQMPRPEYEKFIHSYRSKNGYRVLSRELDGCDDLRIAFARVCDFERTFVDMGVGPWKEGEIGVWIDVFPIDGAPSDEEIAKKRIDKMYRYYRLLLLSAGKYSIDFKSAKNFRMKIRLAIKKLLARFVPDGLADKYIKMSQEYSFDQSLYIANYSTMHYKYREWQPKESMANFVLHKFEDSEFYIMAGYDISLSHLYGDYMKLPPKEKQIPSDIYTYYWR